MYAYVDIRMLEGVEMPVVNSSRKTLQKRTFISDDVCSSMIT